MKRRGVFFLAALLFCFCAEPASAHSEDGSGLITLDGLGVALLFAVGAAYALGLARLWHRAGPGRGIRFWQSLCFATGWLALAMAMLSPLHEWAEHLLTAHMIEHEILMAVAAPLLAVSRPLAAMAWLLPPESLRVVGHWNRDPILNACRRALRAPSVATALHAVALWAWHMPLLFDAAIADETVHWLQHGSFLGTAILFWSAVLGGRVQRRLRGTAVGHLFATSVHMTLLGALMTLAPSPWYRLGQSEVTNVGLTALQDQQLAGLVMWVPAGTVYVAVAIVIAGLWISQSGRDAPRHA